ncbi:hypothetical protein [Croceicoccus sp. YJ47]|uniref:hypothetical protein n=1 Tax=Croceicoccus sp. YJ47 TaxID=2798724 RepID=UPI001920B849|nr:hypothetical protein [Croceicoccus sp. YJ47]QQN73165.1 hypothetical protein JD971_09820 [Croceicoccus sp. YJ47]
MTRWIVAICGAWSQLWNAIWFGNRDQTFSARSWEARQAGRRWGAVAVAMIDTLFFWEPDHCRRSFESDDEPTYSRKD